MIARLRRLLSNLPREVGYGRGPLLMSALRKRWVIFRHPHAEIRFGRGTYLGPGFSLHIPDPGTFICGEAVEFRRGFRAEVARGGRIQIGAHTRFTYDVLIQCSSVIEIGEHCMFGQATSVFDGNHRFRDLNLPMLEQGYDLRPITIADHATTTTKCTIIADLGTRVFLGANSVVTRPIPAYCVAGGNPARVLDYFGPARSEPEDRDSPTDDRDRTSGEAPAAERSDSAADSQALRKPGASC